MNGFGFTDLIWIFFLMSAIAPMFRKRSVEGQRQRMIGQLEAKWGSRVIVMVHRQETMALLGFPVVRFIDVEDSEEVIRAIHMTGPTVPIDLVLHTPGGLVLASLQIARALKLHKGKVTIFVPHYAMSGGTLIALAADEIVMCEHAVLGPVDPQLGGLAAASILSAVERKPVERIEDQTLILADQAEKAISQLQLCVRELLEDKMDKEKAAEVATILTTGTWTHDRPISPEEAREMGLPVSREDMPDEVMKLMSFYRQPVRRQPATVEYLPSRRDVDADDTRP